MSASRSRRALAFSPSNIHPKKKTMAGVRERTGVTTAASESSKAEIEVVPDQINYGHGQYQNKRKRDMQSPLALHIDMTAPWSEDEQDARNHQEIEREHVLTFQILLK
jgi:hypothetical protein